MALVTWPEHLDMINQQFWRGKSVLITGHTGFKGSWLSLWLSQLGAEVHGYALSAQTEPNLYETLGLHLHVDSLIADIRDRKTLNAQISKVKPDVIFHLAAQALVRESFIDPLTTIETNVTGTANVLEAARQNDCVKAVVIVTSDKCYENKEWHWGYRENEPLGGHDPYSASKACAELIVQCWRLSYMNGTGTNGCSVASARAGNVIGGGDWSADRLIPDVLKSVAENNTIVLRNPMAVRPWQHVLEPLAGYIMLAEKLVTEGQAWAQAWNFGPNDSDTKPVSWIVEKLIAALSSKSEWIHDTSAQPHEAQQLKLDCSKAHQVLGWSPAWSLAECIEEIAEWHHAFTAGKDMRKESIKTINRYANACSIKHAAGSDCPDNQG